MKVMLAIFVFFLALSLGYKSVANQEPHETDKAVCSSTAGEKCADAETKHGGGHGDHKTAARDWTPKRLEQVAAVLPEPQANKALAQDPEKVKLVSPKFLARVNGADVKLEWTQTTGAKLYHVQISKDAGFNNRSMYVAEDKKVQGTTFEVKNLEPGQKYFWRVAAVNGDNESMFTKSLFVSSAFETAE